MAGKQGLRRIVGFSLLFFCGLSLMLIFQNCTQQVQGLNESFQTDQASQFTLSAVNNNDLDEIVRKSYSRQGPAPQVGVVYMVWHCMANNPTRNKVIAEARVTGKWGDVPEFHWREVPAATNNIVSYTATNKRLIEDHFAMLEAAKVDFIVVDFTNQSSTPRGVTADVAPQCMLDGFKNLLDVSVARGGKIKIVPWVSFQGDLHLFFLNLMGLLPQQNPNPYESAVFKFKGKPLIIASWDEARGQEKVEPAIRVVEQAGIHVRKMWALHGGALKDNSGQPVWSYQEMCQRGFRESQGSLECAHYNHAELASVSAAYQETYISQFRTAVPKFGGRTLLKQLKTAQNSGAPLILFNTWNEWIAQRFCFERDPDGTSRQSVNCYQESVTPSGVRVRSPINDHFPFDGRPIFTDVYDREYSRDLEPDTEGSEYYELMRDGISAVKGLYRQQYSDIQEVIVSEQAAGRTGHWWCNNHFDRNLGPLWICLNEDCSADAIAGQVVRCGKR